MYALDFEYDNHLLSDFGFIICDFDYSSGAVSVNTGSQITFSKVAVRSGRSYTLTGTKYDECIQSTFDICKNPDVYDGEDREITSEEYRIMARWLNRRQFLRFRIVTETDGVDKNKEPYWYYVSFNIQKITIADKVYGIRLQLESNSPFGYGAEETNTFEFTESEKSKTLTDVSDEIGDIYPNITVTCGESGKLEIKNETLGTITEILNCSVGEEITFLGDRQIVQSNLSSHSLARDFNYSFPKIGNTYDSRINKITVNMSCDMTVKYRPIIKDFA